MSERDFWADARIRFLPRKPERILFDLNMPLFKVQKAMKKDGLRTRAAWVLYTGKLNVLSEITEDRLAMIRGCGASTTVEILEWVDNQ